MHTQIYSLRCINCHHFTFFLSRMYIVFHVVDYTLYGGVSKVCENNSTMKRFILPQICKWHALLLGIHTRHSKLNRQWTKRRAIDLQCPRNNVPSVMKIEHPVRIMLITWSLEMASLDHHSTSHTGSHATQSYIKRLENMLLSWVKKVAAARRYSGNRTQHNSSQARESSHSCQKVPSTS